MEDCSSSVEMLLFHPDYVNKRYPLSGSHGSVFVPPSVDVTEAVLPDAWHPWPGNRFTTPVPLLCYPVPPSWYESPKVRFPAGQPPSLLTAPWPPPRRPSWDVMESLTPEEQDSYDIWEPPDHWYRRARIDTKAMEAHGWHWKSDARGKLTKDLLDDVVNLADSEDFTDHCYEAVKSFAHTWGPLWTCRTSEHGVCHLSQLSDLVFERDPCLWAPVEEVYAFWQFAWEVKAVIEIGQSLRKGQLATPSLYSWLGFFKETFDTYPTLRGHRMGLENVVNQQLYSLRSALGLRINWGDLDVPLPSLDISPMFGIWHLVWMQVAQALCGVYSIEWCTGCQRFYTRTLRRPRGGRGIIAPGVSGERLPKETPETFRLRGFMHSANGSPSPCTGALYGRYPH